MKLDSIHAAKQRETRLETDSTRYLTYFRHAFQRVDYLCDLQQSREKGNNFRSRGLQFAWKNLPYPRGCSATSPGRGRRARGSLLYLRAALISRGEAADRILFTARLSTQLT